MDMYIHATHKRVNFKHTGTVYYVKYMYTIQFRARHQNIELMCCLLWDEDHNNVYIWCTYTLLLLVYSVLFKFI